MCANSDDPRVRRSKQALLAALMQQLQAVGSIGAVSVSDITKLAGVNRSTFYAHYSDKYALFNDMVRAQFGQNLREQLPCPSTFTLADLATLTRATCHFLRKVSGHCSPVESDVTMLAEAQVQQLLQEFLTRSFQENPTLAAHLTLPAPSSALLLSWAIFGAALAWSRGTLDLSVEAVAAQVLLSVHNGFVRAPVLP